MTLFIPYQTDIWKSKTSRIFLAFLTVEQKQQTAQNITD